MAEHALKDGTLYATQNGIVAECLCGWKSAAHFTSLTASAAFQDHLHVTRPPVPLRNSNGRRLLTQDDGNWGDLSNDWPEIVGDEAYDLYVFAHGAIPYGSYVLMDRRGKYGADVSRLRVMPEHIDKLRTAFEAAGKAAAERAA